MLILLSPTKTLDFSRARKKLKSSDPKFLEESDELAKIMKKKSSSKIAKLMNVSGNISALNARRYKDYKLSSEYKDNEGISENFCQAILGFTGPAFVGISPDDFSDEDFEFSQNHLRILCGLYGVLRPLDKFQEYRLEMGTKLETEHGKNLYEFWGDKIAESLQNDLDSQTTEKSDEEVIINVASDEYYKSVKLSTFSDNVKVYKMSFKQKKAGGYKIVSTFAKKARGMMCRYIIKNRITNVEELKGFDMENYSYNKTLSSENEYVFTRTDEQAKSAKSGKKRKSKEQSKKKSKKQKK